MDTLKTAALILVIIVAIYAVHTCRRDYNYDEHITSKGPGDKETVSTYTKRKTYENIKTDSKDSMYVELKTIYLISSGGYINASCDNGYTIFIEQQDKEHSFEHYQIDYQFKTKEDYLKALDYINTKGPRWIINNMYEEEHYMGMKGITQRYEETPEFNRYNTMHLTRMYHANWE